MKSIQSAAFIGECMLELSMAPDIVGPANVAVAGDTLNAAVYLKRVALTDISVSYVTALGDDAPSEKIIGAIEAENIQTALIARRKSEALGLYAIVNDSSGERSFIYWRGDSAARRLLADDPGQLLAQLKKIDVWYFSAISLAILPPDHRDLLLDTAIAFRSNGGIVVFDSNYRPRLWETKRAAQETVMRAWSVADIALPSLDDEMELFDDENEAAIVSRLTNAGVKFGALKRGADGPIGIGWDAGNCDFPGAARIVDTSAAGDSFNGGFLAAHFAGRSPAQSALAGHILASTVIGEKGAIISREKMPPQF